MRSRIAAAAAAALILLLGLLWSVPAAAHADLLSSSPGEEEQLVAVPERVELIFTRPIVAGLGDVELQGPDGVLVASGVLQGDTSLVGLFEPAESVGSWTVVYSAVAEDGHVLTGTIDFVVGQSVDDDRGGPWGKAALVVLGGVVVASWLLRTRVSAPAAPR